jgi:hypothetical protein
MSRKMSLSVCAVTVLALGVALGHTAGAQEKAKASAFDLLRGLAGDWTGTATFGKAGHDKEVHVNYRVTSGGSAVVETLGAGSEHEMVTVFHKDGDDLMLTHYCMIGNQPRMRTERPAADAKKLAFKFAGAANIKSEKDPHMHDLTIEFLAPDHIRSSWTMFKDGKPAETAVFDFKRKTK